VKVAFELLSAQPMGPQDGQATEPVLSKTPNNVSRNRGCPYNSQSIAPGCVNHRAFGSNINPKSSPLRPWRFVTAVDVTEAGYG
jgi:hypothetical protein